MLGIKTLIQETDLTLIHIVYILHYPCYIIYLDHHYYRITIKMINES
jgi:hypothetical protein